MVRNVSKITLKFHEHNFKSQLSLLSPKLPIKFYNIIIAHDISCIYFVNNIRRAYMYSSIAYMNRGRNKEKRGGEGEGGIGVRNDVN